MSFQCFKIHKLFTITLLAYLLAGTSLARATVITSVSGSTTTYRENFNGGSSFTAGYFNTLFSADDYMLLSAATPTSSFSFSSSAPLSQLSVSFWYSVPGSHSASVEYADSGVVTLSDSPGSGLQFLLNNPGASTGGIGGAFDAHFAASTGNLSAGLYTITFSTAGHLFDGFKVDDLVIVTTEQAVSAVPEPGSMAIFGVGLLGVGLVRRRNSRT